MFSRSEKKEPKLETMIGIGTEVEGDIHSPEGLRVDGKVKGSLHAESIVIGPQGMILGDVVANTVTVSGKVKGNVSAATILELLPQAQILGDIRASKLIVSDGAKFEGHCQMTQNDGQIIELNPESIAPKIDNHNQKNLKVANDSKK